MAVKIEFYDVLAVLYESLRDELAQCALSAFPVASVRM